MKKTLLASAAIAGLILTATPETTAQLGAEGVPVVELTYNTTVRDLGKDERGEKKLNASVSIRSMNYTDENGEFFPIDLTPRIQGQEYVIDKGLYDLRVPLLADGVFSLTATARYDIATNTFRDDPPLTVTRTFPTAASVPAKITSEGILYENAFPSLGAHLLIRQEAETVEYLVKWDTRPQCTGNIAVPFILTPEAGIAPVKKGGGAVGKTMAGVDEFAFKKGDFRMIRTKEGRIWDSYLKLEPMAIRGKWNAGELSAEKVINCSFFQDAVLPVYADDTAALYADNVGGIDASVYCDSELSGCTTVDTWDAVHDAITGDSVGDAATDRAALFSSATPRVYFLRPFYHWDILSLGTIDVTEANIVLEVSGSSDNEDNDGTDYVTILQSFAANDSSIITADYDQCGDAVNNPTKLSDDLDITGWIAADRKTFTLNATAFTYLESVAGGYAKFCLREGHDQTDSPLNQGNTGNTAYFKSQAAAGTADDPLLNITYTVVTAPAGDPSGEGIRSGFGGGWTSLLQNLFPKAYAL